jgi:hypothetical protein
MSDKQEQCIDDLKISVTANILELQKRGTLFGKLNAIFQKADFQSTNSTQNLIKRVEMLQLGDVIKQLTKVNDLLSKELERSIRYENKQVYLFSLAKDELTNIFNSLKVMKNISINDKPKFEVYLTDERDQEFKIIYLKSLRNRFENIEISDDDIKRSATAPNEELIKLTKQVAYSMDAYDFLAFDLKKDKLILGGDLIRTFKLQPTDVIVSQITKEIEKLNNLHLEVSNLRNCVSNFEAEKTGKDNLLSIGLMTANGGYNHSGKASTTGQDMRDDIFYQEGIKASDADSYRVKKLYDISDSEHEEKISITLGLTYREYNMIPEVKARFAILDDIQTLSGLKFAIRKVIQHNHN